MRQEWLEAHARTQSFLMTKVMLAPRQSISARPHVAPLAAIAYSDVAQLNLFSKDRNPQVIVAAVEPPKPKPLPPFPVARGVLLWDGTPPTVLLSMRSGSPARAFRAGDRIGDWKIVSLDNQFVVFEWDGKEFKKRIDELMDRSGLVAETAAPPTPAGSNIPPAPKVQSLSDSSKNPKLVDVGSSDTRGCAPGDDSPAGTVTDGFKKVVSQTPFGSACRWEQVK
jgi:hypothetical protein